jgi:hypothetical protein
MGWRRKMNLLPLCILRTPTSCSSSGNDDLLKYGAAAAAAAAVTYRSKRVTVMNLAYYDRLACCSHFKRILPKVSRRQDKTDDLQKVDVRFYVNDDVILIILRDKQSMLILFYKVVPAKNTRKAQDSAPT